MIKSVGKHHYISPLPVGREFMDGILSKKTLNSWDPFFRSDT